MKVFYLIGSLQNGGSERQLLNLCKSFRRNGGAEIYIINWSGNLQDFFYKEFIELGIRVFSFQVETSYFERIRKIRRWILEKQPTIIHSFSFYLNIVARLASMNTRTFPIGSLRSSYTFIKGSNGLIRCLNFGPGQKIVTNTIAGKKELLKKNLWIKKKHIAVVPNHVFTEPIDLKEIYNKRNTQSTFTSVSMGRCDENKRIGLIIDLIHNLNKCNYKVRHIHIGDGPDLHNLQRIIGQLKLDQSFIFLGKRSDVYSYLRSANIFIHVAETEGSPNVVIEAMANGLPVISTKCGDVPFLIHNNYDGILIDINSKKQLMEAYLQLYHDKFKCKNIGENAMKKIAQQYNLIHYNSAMLVAYKELGISCVI